MKKKLLISACLLGRNCKYNGGNNLHPLVERLGEKYDLVPICPETWGGLAAPRPPAERIGDRILDREGRDVTDAFQRGAQRALETARKNGCRRAVLKERSPSCGAGRIYDGTFTGTTVPGDGVAAALLRAEGLVLYGESEIEKLL